MATVDSTLVGLAGGIVCAFAVVLGAFGLSKYADEDADRHADEVRKRDYWKKDAER